MSRRDQLDELDQKIAATFQSSTEELRQEIVERLQETRDRLHRLVQEAAREARSEPGPAPNADLTGLREATSALVAAATQGEILERLLDGAAQFSGRCGFFLVDDRNARLWAGRELAGDSKDLVVPIDGNRPWTRLVQQQGALRLSPEDCRRALGDSTDVDDGVHGVLVPLSLADRLAGALYADDAGDGEGPALEPLQLLVQSASSCLESLSLRPRRLSVALRTAGGTTEPVAPLELWSTSVESDSREEE